MFGCTLGSPWVFICCCHSPPAALFCWVCVFSVDSLFSGCWNSLSGCCFFSLALWGQVWLYRYLKLCKLTCSLLIMEQQWRNKQIASHLLKLRKNCLVVSQASPTVSPSIQLLVGFWRVRESWHSRGVFFFFLPPLESSQISDSC